MPVTELVAELGLERGAETRRHSTASRCPIQQGMYGDSKWRYLSALSCMKPDLPFPTLPEEKTTLLVGGLFLWDLPPCLKIVALQSANILSQSKLLWSWKAKIVIAVPCI